MISHYQTIVARNSLYDRGSSESGATALGMNAYLVDQVPIEAINVNADSLHGRDLLNITDRGRSTDCLVFRMSAPKLALPLTARLFERRPHGGLVPSVDVLWQQRYQQFHELRKHRLVIEPQRLIVTRRVTADVTAERGSGPVASAFVLVSHRATVIRNELT